MRRMILILPLLALASACGTLGVLDNTDSDLTPLVTTVLDRHDAYVPDDADALAESALFRAAFAAPAEIPVTAEDKAVWISVLDRHDVFVQADAGLGDDHRRLYLLSSRNMRATINEVQIE